MDQNVSSQSSLEAFVNAGDDVYILVDKIIQKFDRFRAIRSNSILIAMKTGKCQYTAKISKIPAYMQPYLPGKKLILVLNMIEYDLMSKARKVSTIFHELLHVVSDMAEYKLAKHDVQEFREMIDKVGLDYSRADMLLKELEDDKTQKTETGEAAQ